MNILITGGAGFIGSSLVEYHLAKQDQISVIDNCSTGSEKNLIEFRHNPNFKFIKDDLLTISNLNEIVGQADRIYHMAAIVGVLKVMHDAEQLLATNILATERLLTAATKSQRNPRILLASTSEVYGNGKHTPFKEDDPLIIGDGKKNCNAYVVSKIALEYFGLSFYQYHNLRITSVRIFNTIGHRQIGGYGMVVPRFIQSAIHKEPIVIYGSGKQTRSFCDVRDLIAILDLIAINQSSIGTIVNAGHDQEISINDLALLIKKISKTSSEIQHIPYTTIYGPDFNDLMYRRPNLTKLQAITNYKYQWDLTRSLTELICTRR